MIKSYKVEIKPTFKQLTLFNKACGTARFIYNWALDKRIKYYQETKKSLSYYKQNLELTKLKQENEWMYDVGKFVHQNALLNLQTAFINFFRELKKDKVGFPKFKSKHKNKNSFQIDNDRFYVTENRIKIQTFGSIKLKEKGYIPLTKDIIKYCKATISEEGNRWFISIPVEISDIIKQELTNDVVGVDLGIKTLATCSNGTVFENPKVYKKYLKRLKREQRRLSK
jgi:putative transposase